ncbi:MAG: hypothetical protein JXB48_12275 [Candidatus Latescibacteria bacterium]|nr:hypothetical protein [Candidatus Latescibacterota bacterium]
MDSAVRVDNYILGLFLAVDDNVAEGVGVDHIHLFYSNFLENDGSNGGVAYKIVNA